MRLRSGSASGGSADPKFGSVMVRAPSFVAAAATRRWDGGAREPATVHSITMTARRYGDDEVREIFSLATTGPTRDRSLPAESGGLTLEELQRIGQEVKSDAMALNGLGLVMGGMSLLMGAVVAAAGKPEKALVVLGMFGGMSLAAFGANLLRLPRWARERERQMEAIAEHAVTLLASPQVSPPPPLEPR